jgi:hypothetical protein
MQTVKTRAAETCLLNAKRPALFHPETHLRRSVTVMPRWAGPNEYPELSMLANTGHYVFVSN